jgi:hypothetical protein
MIVSKEETVKKALALFACLLLVLCVIGGCSAEKEPPAEPGAAGHAEEIADSTRMDSVADSMMTEAETMVPDSAAPDSM